jgi:tetratricopeptide (TPR) repeat protein
VTERTSVSRHAWWRRDPGLACVVIALVAVVGLYGGTLTRGTVNYDDSWLIEDNAILATGEVRALAPIWFDFDPDTRLVLGSEYLPVRDMSVLLDYGLWERDYGAFHVTSVLVYAGAIVAWFAALCALGFERRLVGLALLIWALHPAHAESVAWLSERKGVLGMLFAGLSALGYARFRRGERTVWLVVAAIAAAAAVWSKAPSAFAVAALGVLEMWAPGARARRTRALIGLGVLAIVVVAAFVPVLWVASMMHVVVRDAPAPAAWPTMVVGVHGFYMQLAAAVVSNSVSYPIAVVGPSIAQLVLGAVGLAAALATACLPSRGWWRPPPAVRAGAAIWLVGWFPVSRLVLPVRGVVVADRYILFGSLGVALVVAAAISWLPASRSRVALVAMLLVALVLRTFDAQGSWRDDLSLWQRAVASNPADSDAWSDYAEALSAAGHRDLAEAAVRDGLRIHRGRRLVARAALQALERGDQELGHELMREAAEAGEFRAMANLATLYWRTGKLDEALRWARESVAHAPQYAHGQRTLGEIAAQLGLDDEALAALNRALELQPANIAARRARAQLLAKLGRMEEARADLHVLGQKASGL